MQQMLRCATQLPCTPAAHVQPAASLQVSVLRTGLSCRKTLLTAHLPEGPEGERPASPLTGLLGAVFAPELPAGLAEVCQCCVAVQLLPMPVLRSPVQG